MEMKVRCRAAVVDFDQPFPIPLFKPASSAVYRPGGNVAAMPDSRSLSARDPRNQFRCLGGVILPIVVEEMSAHVVTNSRVGWPAH